MSWQEDNYGFRLFSDSSSVHCAGLETNQLQSAQITEKVLGRVTFNFLTVLPAGSKAQLKIDYNAVLRGSMNGYFKSGWKRDGETEYYALTHFQVRVCFWNVANIHFSLFNIAHRCPSSIPLL